MIFPLNAQVYSNQISGIVTDNIVEGSSGFRVHVLAVTMQQEKDLSDTELICNSETVALNYGKDFPQMFTEYICDSQTLYVSKDGNDLAFIQVVYTTSTPIYDDNPINIANGFTYGEIVIGVFLLLTFMFIVTAGLWNSVIGVKSKRNMYNKYLFNSAEGKGDYID